MENTILTILETKRGQKIKKAFGPVIISMLTKTQFLVEDFGFKRPTIDMGRHECWLNFKKEGIHIHIEYELFNYPYGKLSIQKDNEEEVYALDELAPMTEKDMASEPPVQVSQVEKRLDAFSLSIRQKLIETQQGQYHNCGNQL